MNSLSRLTVLPAVSLCFLICQFPGLAQADDPWPQFRGKLASGVATGNPPIEWDVESGKNIQWKAKLPGLAHSAPIVWGDRVYITTAVNEKTDEPGLQTGWLGGTGDPADDEGTWTWQLMALDRATGKTIWANDLCSGEPAIKRHLKATHANCSPATDGQRIVAFFGSEGLYCLDWNGKLLWKKDLGKLHSGPYNAETLEWGFASSPVIYDGHVVVQCDCLNTGFVAIFDIKTGDEVRRINRDDVATWSSPTVIEVNGRAQIVCNGYKQMAGYDFETGDQLWMLNGGGDVPVPTPLFANGLIVITNGHGRSPTYAIDPAARGDLTPSEEADELPDGLAWYQPRDGSYMPTPIIIDDRLYTCNDNGRLAVRDANTGELIYKQRVGSGSTTYSASAVATPERIYLPSEPGVIYVIETGDEFAMLAENAMNEVVMATPAICGDQLFVRTTRHLYCIGEASNE